MATAGYTLLVILLLLLNAFFVLAEFAMVKARPTQMQALAAAGDQRAARVQHLQRNLDAFLSVCQLGITLASIGLGFVGEPAFAEWLKPLVRWVGAGAATDVAAHGIAVSIAYILVSALHIVIGELIPKSVAIRKAEESALLIAYPMIVFHYLFIAPVWVLNSAVNAVLRAFRLPPVAGHPQHTEDEIRIILEQSQSGSQLSFRRLLFIENVLDMGALTARNAMQPRSRVRCLRAGMSPAESDAVIAAYRHSRYPLMGDDPDSPLGYVHVKDLYVAERAGRAADLRAFVRPCLMAQEDDPLEGLLSEMQRKGNHIALVRDRAGRWTGMVTLEDAVEEVIGTIEEEFPLEAPVRLSDLLPPERVLLEVEGDSILAATRAALSRLPSGSLPMPVDEIMVYVAERERLGSSYVGRRLAIPHARLPGIQQPAVVVARLKTPIPAPVGVETVDLLFILLTPVDAPRIHQILLSHIAGIFSSEFLETRVHAASTRAELHNAICTAEETSLA